MLLLEKLGTVPKDPLKFQFMFSTIVANENKKMKETQKQEKMNHLRNLASKNR